MNLPDVILVLDEFGQTWEVTPEDADFYRTVVQAQQSQGTARPLFPLATIVANRGWGWWSAFKSQDEWSKGCGVPIPDHHVLDEAAQGNLGDMLQRFGAYITFLEAQIGLMEGRRSALKHAYEGAIMVRAARLEVKDKAKMTDRAKESEAMAGAESIRHTKRMQADCEAVLGAAKGLRDSYVRAWETVSRLITIRVSEAELSRTGRSS